MLYCRPVFLLLKVLHDLISLQHLHRRLLQGVLPVLVGGAGVDTLARTSRFLRLRGRLNDTRGGVGDGLLKFARCVEDRQVLLSNSWKTRKAGMECDH